MLRFAKSPTSDMNISDLRVAIFNYILAKQLNEPLLIRIDDTEKEKNIEGKEKEILEMLSLFSIDYTNAIYQSENLKYHQKLAMQLMAQKNAFACFCGDEKLKELEEKAKTKGKVYSYDGFCETLSDETVLNCNAPFTVRIKKPNDNIKFVDKLWGELEYKPFEVDYFNILTREKAPTYDYSCAIDDMLSNISTVVRSDDYLSNSAKQIHIRNLLNYDKEINYIHIPNILNSEENSVSSLVNQGFLPSAIANYLVLLGNKTPSEIFSLEEAIQWFNIDNVSKENVKFDIEKLKYINKKHLEMMDDMRLSKILGFADSDIGKLGKVFLKDCSTIDEIKSKVELIFSSKETCKDFEEEFIKIKECIKNAPFIDDFNEFKEHITKSTNLKDENLLKPLRYILTGQNDESNLDDIYPLIKNYLGEIIK